MTERETKSQEARGDAAYKDDWLPGDDDMAQTGWSEGCQRAVK